MPVIAILGTWDTKGEELAFAADELRKLGHEPLRIDVGTGGMTHYPVDVTPAKVAAGIDLSALLARRDRGECVSAMANAAAACVTALAHEGKIHGIFSLGGGGGTAIATAAMRALPLGFPKVMLSTLATGNTAHYLGGRDIVMVPSILDLAGLNRITRRSIRQAVGAIAGIVDQSSEEQGQDRPIIVASMFGNTTKCVTDARTLLEQAGYEVLVFHATGAGGRTMEGIIESGAVAGVLDITTTEWADELVGGVLTAGPTRLDAVAKAGVPAVVVPGCLDMVNFGEPQTVPEKFAERTFYQHNPQVTLMRTNAAESAELGRILGRKVNAYQAPVSVLVPMRGFSVLGEAGQPFHDPAADAALLAGLKETLRPTIRVDVCDCSINDAAFSRLCAEALLANIAHFGARSDTK